MMYATFQSKFVITLGTKKMAVLLPIVRLLLTTEFCYNTALLLCPNLLLGTVIDSKQQIVKILSAMC